MGTPVAYGPGYIGGKGCVRDTPAIAVGGADLKYHQGQQGLCS